MLEIDKVLLLENGEEYLVLDKVTDNDIIYYYIAKLNDTKTDIENNYKLVTISEENNNKVLKEVTGVDTLKKNTSII
ncbi:MAG: hypothetical protein L6V91_08920 [Bacilli bacterium]|nr:MAG: hypothetical protein L6V91_08920 [Bacilli bacterium]